MKENKDKSTLIIQIVAIVLVIAAIVGVIVFIVVNKPKPHDIDKALAGRYNLVEVIDSENKIKLSDFEYNYIDLKEDGYFEIANKVGKTVTSKKGVWYTEGNTLYFEMSKMAGLIKATDQGKLENNVITMTLNSSNRKIVMSLERK